MKFIKEIIRSFSPQNTDRTIENSSKKRIGICLSGGGALGYAHIGVLQALEENGIFPDVISGSSMGAIIGTAYAAGKSPKDMMRLIKDDKLYRITNLMKIPVAFWKTTGFSNHQPLQKLIKEICPDNSFTCLKKEMNVCVANLSQGKWEIINNGSKLDEWIAASASIPGVYTPFKINEKIYVDGGVLNNLPAQALKDRCDIIIGSDVLSHSCIIKNLKMNNTFLASVRTIQHQNSQEGRSLCNIIIEPKAVEKYHEFNFEAYKEIYETGYNAVIKFISDNPEILQLNNQNK